MKAVLYCLNLTGAIVQAAAWFLAYAAVAEAGLGGSHMPTTPRLYRGLLYGVVLVVLLGAPWPSPTAARPVEQGQSRIFPETGKTVAGRLHVAGPMHQPGADRRAQRCLRERGAPPAARSGGVKEAITSPAVGGMGASR